MQIYVSRWSLRRSIEKFVGELNALPQFIVASGFKGLEISDRELMWESDEALADFAQRAAECGCGLILDINCDLTMEDTEAIQSEINHVIRWLKKGEVLGVSIARITVGGQSLSFARLFKKASGEAGENNKRPSKESTLKKLLTSPAVRRTSYRLRTLLPVSHHRVENKIQRAVIALKSIVPEAEKRNIKLGIENHWGISTLPEWINKVVDQVDSPWLGTCVDFANFPNHVSPYEGVKKLMGRAVLVQAKSWNFDATGEEKTLDYRSLMLTVKNSGYDGPVTIEYEGTGDDVEDCKRTAVLAKKYWKFSG